MKIEIGDLVDDFEGNRVGTVAGIVEEENGQYLKVLCPHGNYHVVFVPRGPSFQIEREHVDSLKGWLEAGAKLH
jgi:hypothetical protein